MQQRSQNGGDFIVLDIGGTLSKICIASSASFSGPHQEKLTVKLEEKQLYFHFFKIVEECWLYLRTYFNSADSFRRIIITGGGAYKYSEELKAIGEERKKQITVLQEFQSLLGGLQFFKSNLNLKEFVVSSFSHETKQTSKVQTTSQSLLNSPVLVVNIGSGVSILLVKASQSGKMTAERVGGTCLGGGFFLGLANLLVGENNFQELLKMAMEGKAKNTDFIPEDFPEIMSELSEASVLVSLGKLKQGSSKQDIVRSLFYMVTFNIAQIALETSQIHKTNKVIFTGFYCRENTFFLECFAEAFNFFKRGSHEKKVFSMIHDGFLGTLGAVELQLAKPQN